MKNTSFFVVDGWVWCSWCGVFFSFLLFFLHSLIGASFFSFGEGG